MRLDFLANGEHYKWGKLRSIFDFFFPYVKPGGNVIIRLNAATNGNGEQTFYTFRAFAWHYFYMALAPFKRSPLPFYPRVAVQYFAVVALALCLVFGHDPKHQAIFAGIGAIALDSDTADGNHYQGTLNGRTFAHTCTGTNLALFVAGFGRDGGTDSVTGITYAGAALTKTGSKNTGSADNRYAYLWHKLGPATGANNVVITTSGGDGTAVAVSYTGVSQSGMPDAVTTSSSTSASSLSPSLTTIADNCWLIAVLRNESGNNTAGAGATLRINDTSGNGVFDSNGALTPAGVKSMTIGTTTTTALAAVMASFAPVPPTAVKTYNGLAVASSKTVNGLAIASVKTKNGLA